MMFCCKTSTIAALVLQPQPFSQPRETPSRCSQTSFQGTHYRSVPPFFLLLLRPGRHYRSVPRHPLKRVHTIAVCPLFFFFSPAALVGPFFLRPGRHHRGVPWHFLTREALSQCFSCEQEIPNRCGNEVDAPADPERP